MPLICTADDLKKHYGNLTQRVLEIEKYRDITDNMSLPFTSEAEPPVDRAFLPKLGTLGDENVWKWREHIRLRARGWSSRTALLSDKYDRIKLRTLKSSGNFDSEWLDEVAPFETFPHLSKKQKGLVAFTPSDKYGKQDRQVAMRLGKFIRKQIPGLNDQQIKEIANEFAGVYGENEILWAKGKEIMEIYEDWAATGLESCMQGDYGYEGDMHPSAVYDSPDIELAYLGNPSSKQLDARALINVPNKQYSVVYGNEQLEEMLIDAGYTEGDLAGCRLRHIPYGARSVHMPYLDGTQDFDELDDNWLIVSEEGPYVADETQGICYIEQMEVCSYCGMAFARDESGLSITGNLVCRDCIEEYHVWGQIGDGEYAYIPCDDALFCDKIQEHFYSELSEYEFHWSEWSETYIPESDAVWSDWCDTYLDEELAVTAIDIETGEEYIAPADHEDFGSKLEAA